MSSLKLGKCCFTVQIDESQVNTVNQIKHLAMKFNDYGAKQQRYATHRNYRNIHLWLKEKYGIDKQRYTLHRNWPKNWN